MELLAWGGWCQRERDIQMSPGFISLHQSLSPVQKCRVILMAGIGSSCLFLPNSKAWAAQCLRCLSNSTQSPQRQSRSTVQCRPQRTLSTDPTNPPPIPPTPHPSGNYSSVCCAGQHEWISITPEYLVVSLPRTWMCQPDAQLCPVVSGSVSALLGLSYSPLLTTMANPLWTQLSV